MMTTDETSSLLYPNNLRHFLPNLVADSTVLIPPSDNEGTGVGCCPSLALTLKSDPEPEPQQAHCPE